MYKMLVNHVKERHLVRAKKKKAEYVIFHTPQMHTVNNKEHLCVTHFSPSLEKLVLSILACNYSGNRPFQNPMLSQNNAQILCL